MISKASFFGRNSNHESIGFPRKPVMDSAIDTFVVLLTTEWENYHRRPHWLSQAEISNVLAIEPPAGILVFWMHFDRIKAFIRQRFRIRRGETGILFFRPLSLVSCGVAFRIKLFSSVDRMIIKYQLRKVVRKLGIEMKRSAHIVANDHQYYLADIFPEMITCYEVTDEYSVVPGEIKSNHRSKRARMSLKADKRLLSTVDIVVTSSQPLYRKYKGQFPFTFYLPNGADFNHFSLVNRAETREPDDLTAISPPRIGYIGRIVNTFDFDLLHRLATARKDWSFVMVGEEKVSGPHKRSYAFKEIHHLPNVHFLGFRDYESLPAYLRGMQVCLLPYRLCEWMRHSFPNKVFQYLAAGKPVVSTNFESIRQLKGIVYLAGNADEFLELIEYSLGDHDREAEKRRIKVARLNSTQSRARLTVKVFSNVADKIAQPVV